MNNFSPSTDTSVGTKRLEPSHIGLMYLSRNKARMNAYPFFHILNKAKAHSGCLV